MNTTKEVHESGTKIILVEHQVESPTETVASIRWIVTLPVSQAEVSGVSLTKAQAIADAKLAIDGELAG